MLAKLASIIAPNTFAFAFVTSTSSGTDATSYTFSSVAIGRSAPARQIILAIHTRTGAASINVTSVTIRGAVAQQVIQQQNVASTSALWIARVPGGTDADITITLDQTAVRCGISVYSKIGGSTTATATGGSTAANPTATLIIPPGGVAIGAANVAVSSSWTPTNLTEDVDSTIGGEAQTMTSASTRSSLGGSTAMTLTPGTSNTPTGVFAVWGPSF